MNAIHSKSSLNLPVGAKNNISEIMELMEYMHYGVKLNIYSGYRLPPVNTIKQAIIDYFKS